MKLQNTQFTLLFASYFNYTFSKGTKFVDSTEVVEGIERPFGVLSTTVSTNLEDVEQNDEEIVADTSEVVDNSYHYDDDFYRHLKSQQELIDYIQGQNSEDGFNYYCTRVMEPKYYDYFMVKSKIYLGHNKNNAEFLRNNEEFYRDEFRRFDINRDGYLDNEELTNRQKFIDNLVNPQLGYNDNHAAFENTLQKTIQNFKPYASGPDSDNNGVNFEEFAKYHATTDLIDGYALYMMHDNFARENGRSPENGYICIAEFGWMARIWISLTKQYVGPYEGMEKKNDFYKIYSVTHDSKYRIMELAAWKSRFMKKVIFGQTVYGL